MSKISFIKLSKKELKNLLSDEIQNALKDILTNPKIKELEEFEKPHLTRKEPTKFFSVSLNCINDWCNRGILEPFKVGHRTYFKKTHVLQVLFGSKDT
jgi:hypothetical protein